MTTIFESEVAAAIATAFHAGDPLGGWEREARAAIAVCEQHYAARALPAMDREGLVALLRATARDVCEESPSRHDLEAFAAAILARFAPPAPVGTPQPAQSRLAFLVDIQHALEAAAERTSFALGDHFALVATAMAGDAAAKYAGRPDLLEPRSISAMAKAHTAAQPARVEVGDDVVEAHRAGERRAGELGASLSDQIRAGLRAAFDAAGVVPRAELEAMRATLEPFKEMRAAWQEEVTESLELPADAGLPECLSEIGKLRADLAAATQRAETAERERDRLHAEWRECADSLAVAAMQRDEARALLAGRVTRELAVKVRDLYHERASVEGADADAMYSALTAALGAPAAEPAPVTRGQFDALCDAVDALADAAPPDNYARVMLALKRAKGGV